MRDGGVLAAVEDGRPRPGTPSGGAMVVRPPAVVHTLSRTDGLDVAWCAHVDLGDGRRGLEVRRITHLDPRRVARPRLGGGPLVVAGTGAFERWKLEVGNRLEIREV